MLSNYASHILSNGFKAYIERYVGARWQAVRMARESGPALAAINDSDGPVLIALNHPGWWDPLMSILLSRRMPARSHFGLMESAQLAKFPFFKWAGMIAAPSNIFSLCREVDGYLQTRPKFTLWITPQARFVDVREPIRLNGGAEALRRRFPTLSAWTLSLEYGFWDAPQPEAFLRLAPVAGDLQDSMEKNAAALAEHVRSRDEQRFDTLLGKPASILPWLDAWVKSRGLSPSLKS